MSHPQGKSPIENTTRQMPALAHMLPNVDGYIEGQERAGQSQLVNSDRLPTDTDGTDAEFESLGFTFGRPDAGDSLFRSATLPPGWKRQGSEHAMWSYIVDEQDRKRVAIFYKAAFYDRRAFMRLERVES